MATPPKNQVRRLWDRLAPLPGGKRLFSRLLGWAAPYTATIRARVVELRPGYARVVLSDRRAVRNHLRSIHAMALCNLGEVATGVAMMYGLPDDARGILKGFEVDYVKKGRGTLTAECHCPVPTSNERAEHLVEGTITDEAGDVVTRVRAHWLIGPLKTAPVPAAGASRAD